MFKCFFDLTFGLPCCTHTRYITITQAEAKEQFSNEEEDRRTSIDIVKMMEKQRYDVSSVATSNQQILHVQELGEILNNT